MRAASLQGFTLLEVTIAMGILALGLVAIVDINGGAARLHEASEHLTVATLLARSKLVDLEQKLNEEGFSDFDKEIDGTFDEEKHPEIRWKAEILKPDLTKSSDQLTSLITSAMGGGATSGTGGAGGGLAGALGGGMGGGTGGGGPLSALLGQSSLITPGMLPPGGMPGASSGGSDSSAAPSPTTTGLGGLLGQAATGLIQMQVQQLVQQIQQGVREVRLTITWKDGKLDDSFTVATHFVVLNPTGPGTNPTGAAPPGQSTNPMGSGTPGMPGMPGMPGGMGSTLPGGMP